jgi:hypothetical protein
MMARSTKGEEVRQYFLECERRAQEQASPKLPVLHDPAYQMLLQAVIDLDATRHVLAQVNAKADLALTQQQWITLRQYVFVNKLTRQLPPARMTEYGKWLTGYCVERNIPVSREPVADRPYDAENRYHVGTIEATLPGWLQRRDGQAALRILPGPEQN